MIEVVEEDPSVREMWNRLNSPEIGEDEGSEREETTEGSRPLR